MNYREILAATPSSPVIEMPVPAGDASVEEIVNPFKSIETSSGLIVMPSPLVTLRFRVK